MWRSADLAGLVNEVIAAGADAERLFLEGVHHRAQLKADMSPVTEADVRVELRLRKYCETKFPGAEFLGEEHEALTHSDARVRFVVDPIDGTRAFMRGLPTWSILVGVELDGEPHAAVAYFPATGDLYTGERGHGAFGNGRPLAVSSTAKLRDSLICHGSLAQFLEAERLGDLKRLAESTHTQRGFSDFDGFRQVLHGRADAMIDPGVKAWDLCAAAVLVREAGGRFTDFNGAPTVYGGTGLATNALVHEELLQLIAQC